MSWISRLAQKSIPAKIYSAMLYWKWDFGTRWDKLQLITQGYERNPPMYAAVNLLAQTIASLPFYIEAKGNRASEHELWDALNRNSSFEEYLELQIMYLLVTGETFSQKVMSDYSKKPLGFVTMPSQYTYPMQGTFMNPVERFRYSEYKELFFEKDQVVYIKKPSLSEYFRGFSAGVPLAETISLFNAGITWNKNIALSGGMPQLVAKGQGVTKEKAQQIRESWTEQSGSNNSHILKMVSENLEIQKLTDAPNDAEWSKAIEMSMRHILMAFGVSSELLNDASNKTYSNYKEARKALYLEAAIPIAKKFIAQFNAQVSYHYADKPMLCIDIDEIEALSEASTEKTTRIMQLFEKGILTLEEARNELGFNNN
jgi:HK97 family phage portal protein